MALGNKAAAELVGTFWLVFGGCGSAVLAAAFPELIQLLGFSAGERLTLTGLRRAHARATGIRLAPSSFHARFSEQLTALKRTLSLEALQRQARARPRLKAVFAPFVEVLAVDSSLLRLHHALVRSAPDAFSQSSAVP
jgi:hypothetical protein